MAFSGRYPNVRRRVAALALTAVLVGACGGGDEDEMPEASTTTAAAAEAPASYDVFCESAVAMEEAIFRTATGGEAARPIEPLVDEVEASAPAELEAEVAAVVEAVRQTLETGDDAALRDPAFGDSEESIDAWIADNCGFESVRVSAVDYAFEGVPQTLPAGITTFHFRNDGEELHEMLTLRLTDDTISAEDLGSLSEAQAGDAVEYLGSAFAEPGDADADSRDLVPGRYALVCLLPVGSTGAGAPGDGPSHLDRGMWAEVVVR